MPPVSLLQFAGFLASIAYVVFCCTIAVKAVIHRRRGWISAVILSLLMLTLPLWVGAMYWAFLAINQIDPDPSQGMPP